MKMCSFIHYPLLLLFLGGWVLVGVLLNPVVSTPRDKELHADDLCS